jgi:hypothetical protein
MGYIDISVRNLSIISCPNRRVPDHYPGLIWTTVFQSLHIDRRQTSRVCETLKVSFINHNVCDNKIKKGDLGRGMVLQFKSVGIEIKLLRSSTK